MLFFFNDTATTEIYTLSLHDALPIFAEAQASGKVQTIFAPNLGISDDKGVYPFIPEMIRTYLGEEPILHNAERSEEHTSELQSRQYLVCRLLLENIRQTRSDNYLNPL